MAQRTFSLITGLIFLLIALLHGMRLLYGWEAMIGGWEVPIWLSWIAVVIALYLGYQGVKLAKK